MNKLLLISILVIIAIILMFFRSDVPIKKNNQPVCNNIACNQTMYDYIVNKYWAFNDSSKVFGECKNCQSRWFRAPYNVSKDGIAYNHFDSKQAAYDYAKL